MWDWIATVSQLPGIKMLLSAAKVLVPILVGGLVLRLVLLAAQHEFWRMRKTVELQESVYDKANVLFRRLNRNLSIRRLERMVADSTANPIVCRESNTVRETLEELDELIPDLIWLSKDAARLFSESTSSAIADIVFQANTARTRILDLGTRGREPLTPDDSPVTVQPHLAASLWVALDRLADDMDVLPRLSKKQPGEERTQSREADITDLPCVNGDLDLENLESERRRPNRALGKILRLHSKAS